MLRVLGHLDSRLVIDEETGRARDIIAVEGLGAAQKGKNRINI